MSSCVRGYGILRCAFAVNVSVLPSKVSGFDIRFLPFSCSNPFPSSAIQSKCAPKNFFWTLDSFCPTCPATLKPKTQKYELDPASDGARLCLGAPAAARWLPKSLWTHSQAGTMRLERGARPSRSLSAGVPPTDPGAWAINGLVCLPTRGMPSARGRRLRARRPHSPKRTASFRPGARCSPGLSRRSGSLGGPIRVNQA